MVLDVLKNVKTIQGYCHLHVGTEPEIPILTNIEFEEEEIIKPVEQKVNVQEMKTVQTESYLKTGILPILSVITDDETEDNNYHVQSKAKLVYGHGPFIILLPIGKDSELPSYELKFTENKDYTVEQIVDIIRKAYSKPYTKSEMKKIVELSEHDEYYDQLLEDMEQGENVYMFDLNDENIYIDEFIKVDKDIYKLRLGK